MEKTTRTYKFIIRSFFLTVAELRFSCSLLKSDYLRANVGRMESCFNWKAGNLERRWTNVPKKKKKKERKKTPKMLFN